MKSKNNAFILIALLFVTIACQETTAAATNVPTITQVIGTDASITSTVISPSNSVQACKLHADAVTNVGLGFPVLPERLRSTGTVKSEVLFVDFPDAPASGTPQELFAQISPNAEKLYDDISYGRMNYELVPHFVWLRLSQNSQHYADGLHSFDGHQAFIQEAVSLADADVDFSGVDSIVVMATPEATAITFGPAFGGTSTNGISADGKIFANALTSGADLFGWGYLWLNHETGHNMSLADLYAYDYDTSNYSDQHRFVGTFGLMGFIAGKAPEYFAFERWQLGWLDDNQIVCQTINDQTTTLTAIEKTGSTKAVIVPLSDTKAVVVESRRPFGYDQALPKSGALVYEVNTSIYSGEGPIVVYPNPASDPYREQSPLAMGESVTVENVKITVINATEDSDTVKVMVTN